MCAALALAACTSGPATSTGASVPGAPALTSALADRLAAAVTAYRSDNEAAFATTDAAAHPELNLTWSFIGYSPDAIVVLEEPDRGDAIDVRTACSALRDGPERPEATP